VYDLNRRCPGPWVVVPRRRWDIRLLRGFGGEAAGVVRVGVGGEEEQAWKLLEQRDLVRRKIRSQNLHGFALAGLGC
jgi:hypothetical protein